MAAYRKILHIDLDAFFCSVEELLNPSLIGKVFAVGGSSENRGVLSTCSYAARKLGLHSAMPTAQALRICPNLILVHSGFSFYKQKSREVMQILGNYSPLLEQISIDEAFLDVSDLPDPPEQIAAAIQKEINEKTRLHCSIGCGTNKLIAKIANNMGKKQSHTNTYPNAITNIPAGHEAAFLAPLPVGEIWGIGKKTETSLNDLGIFTAEQLAAYPTAPLSRIFGKNSAEMQNHARGIDNSPVLPDSEPAKSISQETTFPKDISDPAFLLNTIQEQSDQVGFQLRQKNLRGNTIRLKIRWENFVTITRQIKVSPATDQDSVIFTNAQSLFETVWKNNSRPVRLIGTGVTGTEPVPEQLSFLENEENHIKETRLLQAVDKIHIKYGEESLKRGFEISASDKQLSIEKTEKKKNPKGS